MKLPHAFPQDAASFLTASGIGMWQYDAEGSIINLNDIAAVLFGTTSNAVPFDQFIAGAFSLTEDVKALFQNHMPVEFLSNAGTVLVKGSYDGTLGAYLGTVQKYHPTEFPPQKDNFYRSLVEQASVATSLYVGPEMKIEIANDVMLGYWGKGKSILGLPLAEALPELVSQPFLGLLDKVFTTGTAHEETEAAAQLAVNGVLSTYYFDYTYKPVRNERGEVFGVMNIAVDVTERVLTKKKQYESEALFRQVTEQSPVAIGFLKGAEMRIELANDTILKIWGKDKSVIGLPLIKGLPEIEGQGFAELLMDVYTTGKIYKGDAALVKLEHEGVLTDFYVDFTYSPLRNEKEEVFGVLVVANDVTEQIRVLKEIEASEQKFRSVIYSAPAAVAVFKGPDLVGDIANDEFLRFTGRNREDFIGRPLLESMPEIRGQESVNLMREVYTKGIKTHHFGRQVNIMRNGILTQNFYNVSYSPLYDVNGAIYAVLDIAIDVTETIKAQEALRESDASLRGAIELADLATWSLDPVSERFTYSARLKEWLGLDGEPEVLDDSLSQLHVIDQERIRQAVFKAIDPEGDGAFNEEFSIINRINGSERILHAVGKTFFDENGIPYLLTGTAQDITSTKIIQMALETQVRERTEALQRANYELEEINQKLLNTNQELEQYAYVASHDLQEPLRKISMFSNLLKERDADKRNEVTIDKIIAASQRMSLLIKDLLEFSRLIQPNTRFVPVDLNQMVQNVTHDFELLIEEKAAAVVVETLPVIDAVPLQMNQLLYNLMGNALKFTAPGITPVIKISATQVSPEEAALYIKTPMQVNYFKICIADNGIGIEEQYQKQIFEVFKRLHSRSEYSGSGIGLALCRRIVNNHNGSISIQSAPGSGTTFSIYLPQHQNL